MLLAVHITSGRLAIVLCPAPFATPAMHVLPVLVFAAMLARYDASGAEAAATPGSSTGAAARPITTAEGAPVLLVQGFALDPVWSASGRFLIYSGADVGTTFPLKAVTADGSPYPLPELVLSRGARRVAFLGGDGALVTLKGDVSHKELWVRDLETGRERQLTALGRGFTIGDFDISPDGRELLFDRSRDESDIVLIERPK